jgi:hypothetical protein
MERYLTDIWVSFQNDSGKLRPSIVYTSSQWTREDKFLDTYFQMQDISRVIEKEGGFVKRKVELEVIKPTFSWIRLKEQTEESQVRLYLMAAGHVQALKFHRCSIRTQLK